METRQRQLFIINRRFAKLLLLQYNQITIILSACIINM